MVLLEKHKCTLDDGCVKNTWSHVFELIGSQVAIANSLEVSARSIDPLLDRSSFPSQRLCRFPQSRLRDWRITVGWHLETGSEEVGLAGHPRWFAPAIDKLTFRRSSE